MKCSKKNTDAQPKTLQHGPLGRSWGNLFVESVLDRTLDPFLTCFGAFGGALGTISASLGTKNITRNRYQFEVLCWTRFCLSFWSTLGSLGSAFGSFLDIFSDMAAKVRTVLAPARELDFQGLGASGSVLFESLARTSFWETSFERIWTNLNRFGGPLWHPFRQKTRSVLRRSAPQSRTCMETVANGRERSGPQVKTDVKVYLNDKAYD